jgi:branched-chain amino acid transport system ATP-binding protein
LAHGDQRKLELAIAIALEPRLLILDEPTQGMSERDVKETIGLIRMISRNKTILIIEHNMDVVLDLAERITVFDKGRIIAEGTSSEIEQDQNVIDSYLGAEWRGR